MNQVPFKVGKSSKTFFYSPHLSVIDKSENIFKNRKLLIATKHGKEKVIAPILEKALGVTCIINLNFDSDVLGTFSGEIERKNDALTTAKNKCIMAMEYHHCDLAIASEGSFGPHPSLYFVAADDEILFLIDKKNNLEIFSREISTKTNFNGAQIRNLNELKEFAKTVKFPTHALIIKKGKDDFEHIAKDIFNWDRLLNAFQFFINQYGSCFIETDMRAMNNPTRMKVIKKATQNLVKKINSICPQCNAPGFEITTSKKGLPCEACSFPTQSALSYTYTCKKCNYEKEKKFPNRKKTEQQLYCDICNP